uniref:S1 motif domain-containing protein n=1 Tax=Rhodosorus marinus TaxID=101924 RepID=A0A7S2ZNP6_9RHOD|mmetsp:Transcript_2662/g.11705  ORF Transcript_2662/g.11705 Transcript_2662/m.11705 type:complete len:174 (+) Transcript_2662:371-892(+)
MIVAFSQLFVGRITRRRIGSALVCPRIMRVRPAASVEDSMLSSSVEDKAPQLGDIVEGLVVRIERYGFFVDIGRAGKGLVHVSEIANEFVSKVEGFVSVGEIVRVKVISISPENGKIALSLKQAEGHNAEKQFRQRRCELGGDWFDPWNADGETVWIDLGPRPPNYEELAAAD